MGAEITLFKLKIGMGFTKHPKGKSDCSVRVTAALTVLLENCIGILVYLIYLLKFYSRSAEGL